MLKIINLKSKKYIIKTEHSLFSTALTLVNIELLLKYDYKLYRVTEKT